LFRLYESAGEEDDEEWRKKIDGGGDLTDKFKHKVRKESVFISLVLGVVAHCSRFAGKLI
jgi:hypothetical protein